MPAMVLLGRRWLVGSDDLAVPFACLGFIDLFWCVPSRPPALRQPRSDTTLNVRRFA